MVLKMGEATSILCLAKADLGIPTLFQGMEPKVKPVKALSQRYSQPEQSFIGAEIRRLLKARIIEERIPHGDLR